MDFEPCLKVHSLISLPHTSIKLVGMMNVRRRQTLITAMKTNLSREIYAAACNCFKKAIYHTITEFTGDTC